MPTLTDILDSAPPATLSIFIVGDEEGFHVALSLGGNDSIVGIKTYPDQESAISAVNKLKGSLVSVLGENQKVRAN